VNCDWNSQIANGNVRLSTDMVRTKAKTNSFHILIALKIAMVAIPALLKGNIMVKNILYLLLPSISAASSNSLGIDAIKAVKRNTEIGKLKANNTQLDYVAYLDYLKML